MRRRQQFQQSQITQSGVARKLAAELMIEEFADAYNLRYAINRCGLIAGPWQMGKVDQGVVALWLAAHVFERPLRYIGFGGQGKQVRDVLHVDDLAELVASQAGCMQRFHGLTLNVGGGLDFSLSLQELTAECEQLTGRRIEIGSEPAERPADLRIYVTDARKIEQDLMEIVPRKDWIIFAHLLIFHGRRICKARRPLCEECLVEKLCPSSILKTGKVPK